MTPTWVLLYPRGQGSDSPIEDAHDELKADREGWAVFEAVACHHKQVVDAGLQMWSFVALLSVFL